MWRPELLELACLLLGLLWTCCYDMLWQYIMNYLNWLVCWISHLLFAAWLVMSFFSSDSSVMNKTTHLPNCNTTFNSFHWSHFITAYINTHPTTTQTTHTKNMFIFQISASIFCSSSFLFFSPFGGVYWTFFLIHMHNIFPVSSPNCNDAKIFQLLEVSLLESIEATQFGILKQIQKK